jgi:hypothetical protein
LWEELKSDGLIIWGRFQSSSPCVLLAAFSLVYSENHEQKSRTEGLKNCSLPRKEA